MSNKKNKTYFVDYFKTYLIKAGINLIELPHDTNEILQLIKNPHKDVVLCFFPSNLPEDKETQNYEELIDYLNQFYHKNTFCVLPADNAYNLMIKRFHIANHIILQNNYYFSILDILQKFMTDDELKKLINTFKAYYLQTCAINKELSSPLKVYEDKNNRKITLVKQLLIKKWFKIAVKWLIILCVLISIILVLITINPYGSIPFNKNNSQTLASIRSELPLSNALLERPILIDSIKTCLRKQKDSQILPHVCITGKTGTGKTILAHQFARSIDRDKTIVWKLNAETKEDLIKSLTEFAYALAQSKEKKEELKYIQMINDNKERQTQIVFFVKLNLKMKNNWLLIYDNVSNFAEILEYYPRDPTVWGKGEVILTSRDSHISNINYINPENIIQLGELNKLERLTLLSRILYNCEPNKLTSNQVREALNFLREIPPFPLDISTDAHYMKLRKIRK